MAPFSSDQTQGGALVVIHDVTEQRKSEQSRREFVANVSHELRTPLTNIKSYAETIVSAGDELPRELHDNFMGVIINEADRMTRIVQDLLTLSKIDYGKMEMNISRFSFAKAISNVYEAARLNAEQNHHHTMVFHCEDNIPDVLGDRERIEQVVMNIVSNAIKYTPDGGKIEIYAGSSGKSVFVRVTDNGIGIPEKDLPRLFERFYRVDKARSRESGGTGLRDFPLPARFSRSTGAKLRSTRSTAKAPTCASRCLPRRPKNKQDDSFEKGGRPCADENGSNGQKACLLRFWR